MSQEIITTEQWNDLFWQRQRRRELIIREQENIKGLKTRIKSGEDFIAKLKKELIAIGGSVEGLE